MIARLLTLGCAVAAIGACEARDLPIDRYGFRSSSAALLVGQASGPPVLTPAGSVAMPAAGISRSCLPIANGIDAACRTF